MDEHNNPVDNITEKFYKHGELHNESGPAVVTNYGVYDDRFEVPDEPREEFYLDGEKYSKEEYMNKTGWTPSPPKLRPEFAPDE